MAIYLLLIMVVVLLKQKIVILVFQTVIIVVEELQTYAFLEEHGIIPLVYEIELW